MVVTFGNEEYGSRACHQFNPQCRPALVHGPPAGIVAVYEGEERCRSIESYSYSNPRASYNAPHRRRDIGRRSPVVTGRAVALDGVDIGHHGVLSPFRELSLTDADADGIGIVQMCIR